MVSLQNVEFVCQFLCADLRMKAATPDSLALAKRGTVKADPGPTPDTRLEGTERRDNTLPAMTRTTKVASQYVSTGTPAAVERSVGSAEAARRPRSKPRAWTKAPRPILCPSLPQSPHSSNFFSAFPQSGQRAHAIAQSAIGLNHTPRRDRDRLFEWISFFTKAAKSPTRCRQATSLRHHRAIYTSTNRTWTHTKFSCVFKIN
ncbi:uncharacterized protein LOC133639747 [Entelurus aequoreus]|uniref:uncharacterized protein LOC133639747 n=1 Tax=Entelurus aequoreus TaxID=161455 RepID=UPI002B1E81F5|nr:uncharacterized protein LOC133639747 [Entelurus aequoreus]